MIRNFFNYILSKPGGEFDASILDKLSLSSRYSNKITQIKEFYQTYHNIFLQNHLLI